MIFNVGKIRIANLLWDPHSIAVKNILELSNHR